MSFYSADTPVDALSDWLMEQALSEPTLEELVEGCNRRLHAAGIPVLRSIITSPILHPLYQSFTVVWTFDGGIETTYHVHDSINRDAWKASPLRYILMHRLPTLRRQLAGENAVLDFPVLEELAENGMTDYLCYLVPFGEEQTVNLDEDEFGSGIIGSWATDRPAGFSDADLRALNRVQQRLAVAVKMRVKDKIAENILETYLGLGAGRKVLDGQIKRGDGERIYSVIWYSDLRGSTTLADHMAGDKYIELLNRYFECTANAVLECQGEVLRFPGDAVLGIFPINEQTDSSLACMNALKAAPSAFEQLDELNSARAKVNQAPLNFGIGLHVGEVLFGNIGVPQRLEFSVIGPAMNETARLEALTKDLHANILTSENFVNHLKDSHCKTIGECKLLGEHVLHGIDKPMNVYEYLPNTAGLNK
jgi:adenylate cyclase